MSGAPAHELRAALRAGRGALLATGGFSLFINLLMLTAPLYMLQVYDRVLASRSESTLVALTTLAIALLVVMGLLDWIRSRVLVRVGAQFDTQLKDRTFSAVFADSLTAGGAPRGHHLRDLDTVRQFMTGAGPFALFDAPWAPIYVLVVYALHPNLGHVAALGAVVLFALALVNELRTRKPLEEAGQELGIAAALAETSLRNAEVVHALGMENALRNRWGERHVEGLRLQGIASDRAGTLMASSKTLRLCLQIAILGVGAGLAIQQHITPGAMIAASILMGRALAPVEQAIAHWRSFLAARSAYAGLHELLLAHPMAEPKTELPAPKGRLTAEDLVIAPPGADKPVLSGVSFSLEPGEALGVIGPTASGKSTLARHLIGVWQPARGSVRLDGALLSEWQRADLGPYVGYLPQDVELFSGSVAHNIARLAPMANSQAVVGAAMRAGAHEMILRLPQGYDTPIGVGGCALSAGQRQRIGLARALYGKPVLVVLDEPNANLDTSGDQALVRAIELHKKAGATVVVMAHRPAALACVDKVMVLSNGRMQAFGSKQEILGEGRRVRAPASAPAATPPGPASRKMETGHDRADDGKASA